MCAIQKKTLKTINIHLKKLFFSIVIRVFFFCELRFIMVLFFVNKKEFYDVYKFFSGTEHKHKYYGHIIYISV